MVVAAGSGNTDFISTKMNLFSCPDVQTLHPMPSAGGSAQVNSDVSNIEKKRCCSEEAGISDLMFFQTFLLLFVALTASFCLTSENINPSGSVLHGVCKLTKRFAAVACMLHSVSREKSKGLHCIWNLFLFI